MTLLVTGAARGIGRALVQAAAAGGQEVIGTYRGERPAIGAVEWQVLEVSDSASHHALADRLAGRPLSGLICNAGVLLDGQERLEDGYPAPMWAETFAVNVTGVFLTVQALLANLRAGRERFGTSKIMILSSQMASQTRAPGGSYIYRASKAAALNLGRNLAADLKGQGIPVGIYHPGWVQTDMGGPGAAITEAESARGLMDRLAALTLATTGCFETWDGRAHPM